MVLDEQCLPQDRVVLMFGTPLTIPTLKKGVREGIHIVRQSNQHNLCSFIIGSDHYPFFFFFLDFIEQL